MGEEEDEEEAGYERTVGETSARGIQSDGFHRGYVILTALFNRPFSAKAQIKRLLCRNYTNRTEKRDKRNERSEP